MPAKVQPGCRGDRIEVSSPGGETARRGVIVDVIGGRAHARYRVRWRDGRESIHYPSDGTRIGPRELTDEELHELLPTALDRPSGPDDASADIPWDQPVQVYADHFRG